MAHGSREKGTFPCSFPFHQLHGTIHHGQLAHSLGTFVLSCITSSLGAFAIYVALVGRIRARYLADVSPIPPLDPYVRLSPHTAHERGTFTGSFHFANSTEHSPCQLARSLATFVPFPHPLPRGLRHQSLSWCTQLSWVQTTMPRLTACRASEISVRVSPPYFPLSLPSLAGSPVFSIEDSNKMM